MAWSCWSSRGVWTVPSDIWHGWCCVGPRAGLDGPYGSHPAEGILWFYEMAAVNPCNRRNISWILTGGMKKGNGQILSRSGLQLVARFEINVLLTRKVFVFDSFCKHHRQTIFAVNHTITLSRNTKCYSKVHLLCADLGWAAPALEPQQTQASTGRQFIDSHCS